MLDHQKVLSYVQTTTGPLSGQSSYRLLGEQHGVSEAGHPEAGAFYENEVTEQSPAHIKGRANFVDGNDEELSHIQQPQPASSDLFRSIWSAFSISEAEFLA